MIYTSYKLEEQLKKNDYVLLASLDEGESYEVDEYHVAYNTKTCKLLLLTGYGCSCWSGEYDDQEFNTFTDFETFIMKDTSNEYCHPSLKGAEELVRDAHSALVKYMCGCNDETR